ncbi:hypothetical protein EXS74_03650 [Candidatus Woesearchaeota archaeon]|nr:hypothetical protein [Candidatus Woesearchaeota archaeon]
MEEIPSRVFMKRQTAYKVWIKDIHSAKSHIDTTSGLPSFIIRDKTLARVNFIASVIDTFSSGTYGSIVVDDGSGQIRLKVWGDDLVLLEARGIGDLVLIIGRVSQFNDERYVRPEIVRTVSQDWALLRRLELIKEYGVPQKEDRVILEKEEESSPEVEPSLAAREIILARIEKQEEVSEEEVFKACSLPREKVALALYDLLKEGEIFSPKKGYYRLV